MSFCRKLSWYVILSICLRVRIAILTLMLFCTLFPSNISTIAMKIWYISQLCWPIWHPFVSMAMKRLSLCSDDKLEIVTLLIKDGRISFSVKEPCFCWGNWRQIVVKKLSMNRRSRLANCYSTSFIMCKFLWLLAYRWRSLKNWT